MNNLQIKRLSMNSISRDYSYWVKIGQTFLNLFIASNRMIVCSESTIVRNDVYLLVQDSDFFPLVRPHSVPVRVCWDLYC